MTRQARRLLEEAQIQWRRDLDALTLGFVLGVLATIAARNLWP